MGLRQRGAHASALLCLLPQASGRAGNDTLHVLVSFGHFHLVLLLWSGSSDEELGLFSSSWCINEGKAWTIFLWGGYFDPRKKSFLSDYP